MRCATGLFIIVIAIGSVGCRNQSTPLTNPFLQADRVPPPSTQILPPGAAQPYYPGDPAPGAMAPAPATGVYPPAGNYAVPPITAPPGTAAPAPYPAGPITPTAPAYTPPAGYPTYQPQAQTGVPSSQLFGATTGDTVQVPSDGSQLRFGTPSVPASPISTAATVAPTLPSEPYPVQQATFNQPVANGQIGYQRLQQREILATEFPSPPAPSLLANSAAPTLSNSGDGFRPQSADATPSTGDSSAAQGFRSPSLANGATSSAGAKSSNERFAVGPGQDWLRGQLEYWPENGQWSIRYMPDGQVDQIGGRILIDNPQVLGNLPPGEFVMVEGQVFGRQIDPDHYQPVYRVSVVQRQRR